jgi:hypothetical protein
MKARSKQDPKQNSQFAYIGVMHEAKMTIIDHFDLPQKTKDDAKRVVQCYHDVSVQMEMIFSERSVEPSDVKGLFRNAARLFNRLIREDMRNGTAPSSDVRATGKRLNRIAKKLNAIHRNDLENISQAVINGYERIFKASEHYVSSILGKHNFGLFSALMTNAHEFFCEFEPADGDKLGQDPTSN